MKTQKIIRYSMPVTRRFPSGHRREGEPTYFVEAIQKALGMLVEMPDFLLIDIDPKLHTIRNNKNNVWNKRMKKVLDGKAVIDLFYWKLPGGRWAKGNERIVFATLDKDSVCGVQKLELSFNEKPCYVWGVNNIMGVYRFIDDKINIISNNDGLSLDDFKSWFKRYDLNEPLAIIHFTKFRY